MRFANFMQTVPVNTPIAINPMLILAISPFLNHTQIHVAVPNQNGTPFVYSVTGTAQQAAAEVQAALAE